MAASSSFTHALIILLVLAQLLTGCATKTTSIQTYQIVLDTDPPSAHVTTTADDLQILSTTPTSVRGDYEFREYKKDANWWWPIVGGAVLFVAGTAMVAGGLNSESRGTKMGLTLGGGYGMMTGMVLPGLSIWAKMQDGKQYVRRRGDDDWTFVGRHLSEDELLRTLPRLKFSISREGYLDRDIMARPGDNLTLELIRDPKAPAIATPTPTPKPTPTTPTAPNTEPAPLVELPSFLSASPQASAFALVIGIENYRNLPAPLGARLDAEGFATLLQQTMGLPARNIRVLIDEHATRSDILSELTWLHTNVPPGSRIYFFFSGHGTPDIENGRSFMLPYEGSPETLAHSAIALDEIITTLEQTQARDILAFVDTCFSGADGRSILPEGLRPLVPVRDPIPTSRIALFTSSSALEVSGTLPDKPIGLFTHHLLLGLGRGIADANGDSQISLKELQDYVTPRVTRDAHKAARTQTPTLQLRPALTDPNHVIVSWGVTAPQ